MDSSHLKFISLGTVAESKNDGSKFISVFLREHFPFVEGDITNQHVTINRSGVDADGIAYNHSLQRGQCVKCEWIGAPNRITSPNVAKGETVKVYTLGKTNVYYWKEMGRDNHLRRTETVVHAYNANGKGNDVDVATTGKNAYITSVDTKNGHITVSTSQANGELAGYTVQLNGRKGHLTAADQMGNIIQMDTVSGSISFKNASGTFVTLTPQELTAYAVSKLTMVNEQGSTVTMVGGDATISAPGSITAKAPKLTLDGPVTITGDLTIQGKTTGQEADFTIVKTPDLQAANNPT